VASTRPTVLFPNRPVAPQRSLARRVCIALAVVVIVALITLLDRKGYRDANGDGISVLDAIYYSTVTVTTTGYGDIVPSSRLARAMTAFIVTPLRVVFLIVLVGTTIAVLTERFKQGYAESRWRKKVKDHTIVAGYGMRGRGAVDSLLASGVPLSQIVVIEHDGRAVEDARASGLTVVLGDATRTAVLNEAMVGHARAVIVTCGGDDTATLVTLTTRELSPAATIVAAAHETENAHLLRQSGASTVIVSSESSGRLLGLATSQPRAVGVLEDLIVAGEGLQLIERLARPDEIGRAPVARPGELPITIVRDGHAISFADAGYGEVRAGDVVVSLQSGH
jgi:voltage-gated potassium channel